MSLLGCKKGIDRDTRMGRAHGGKGSHRGLVYGKEQLIARGEGLTKMKGSLENGSQREGLTEGRNSAGREGRG